MAVAFGISIRPSHVHEEHLDLLAAPFQAPGERAQGDGLDAQEQDLAPVHADGLENAVLGPGADRDVEHAHGDVDEAGLAHLLLEREDGCEVDVERGEAVVDVPPELGHGVVLCHAAVVGLGVVVYLLHLVPAPGFEVSVAISFLSFYLISDIMKKTYSSACFNSFGQFLIAMTMCREWM